LESKYLFNALQGIAPFLLYMPDPMRGWYLRAREKMNELLAKEKFDILFSWAQPFSSHLLALYIKKQTNLPWVAHFSDPLIDNPFYYQFLINPHRKINTAIENRIVRSADQIHFVSEETASLARKRYDQKVNEKIYVIPHVYDSDFYPESQKVKNSEDVILITHIGSFTGKRNPVNFLRALALLKNRSPSLVQQVRVRFVGRVASKYQKLIRKLNLSDVVECIGYVPYLESLRYMVESDHLLLIDAKFEGTSIFFPSKLVDYFGAGRPILAITPSSGSSARLLREAGINVMADPEDIEDIASLLNQHIHSPLKPSKMVRYSREFVTMDLLNRFEELIS
jgi:glycosyltransferase involved in cell wall biosynthesis